LTFYPHTINISNLRRINIPLSIWKGVRDISTLEKDEGVR